jgi:hypothetical protein
VVSIALSTRLAASRQFKKQAIREEIKMAYEKVRQQDTAVVRELTLDEVEEVSGGKGKTSGSDRCTCCYCPSYWGMNFLL